MTYGPDLLVDVTTAYPRLACLGLELALYSDTQWATAYLDGKPFATIQRAGVYDREAPRWQAYDLNGKRFAHAATARGIVRLVTGAAAWASIRFAPPRLPSPAECIALATHAAKAAGFASPEALRERVICRGYVPGVDDLGAFNRAQSYLHHVVQPLLWAADPGDDANRRAWVVSAYRGAFFVAMSGRA